jgi:hypothetical protein
MYHKRKRSKHRRAGCLLCKPSKLTANWKADRAKARREWQAQGGGRAVTVAPAALQ